VQPVSGREPARRARWRLCRCAEIRARRRQRTQRTAEALTAAYQRGEVTDVAKVMLARQEAGVAFEATLQVRNRLLSAYQDIMRMGV
jgi:flagellar hook-basal body complex protein FliE